MNSVALDSAVAEIEANEADEAVTGYDAWFRAKVQEAQASTRPVVSHEEMLRRMVDRLNALQVKPVA